MIHWFRTLILALSTVAAVLGAPAVARDSARAERQASEAASQPSAGQADSGTAAVPVRPALWKVSDEDTTIYLFGTIHVLPAKVDWFEGKIATAFEQSDVLVTEIVETDNAKMQALVLQKALLPADQSLRALLSDEERAAYEAALGQYSIPAVMLDRFEPWYAAVALSTLPLLKDGFASENGVETTLDARAIARKMPHTALETPEYQLDLFDNLPADVQHAYLAEVIEQLPHLKQELGQMVEAWKRGDPARLAELMNAEESNPVLLKTLLTDRNKAWATWIHARLAQPGTVFLAVGAGHLGGPGSVQEQLGARAIAVERLQ